MKSVFLGVVLTLFALPAFACSYDTDCSPGSKCSKPRGQMNGICTGGINPGNNNDRSPVYDRMNPSSKVGNTCNYNTDCGFDSKCVKSGGINGVCVPK